MLVEPQRVAVQIRQISRRLRFSGVFSNVGPNGLLRSAIVFRYILSFPVQASDCEYGAAQICRAALWCGTARRTNWTQAATSADSSSRWSAWISAADIPADTRVEHGLDRPAHVPDARLSVTDFAVGGDALKERHGLCIHEQFPEDGTRAVGAQQAERTNKMRPGGSSFSLVRSACASGTCRRRSFRRVPTTSEIPSQAWIVASRPQ